VTLKELTLQNIEALDFGKAARAFQLALRRAVDDCNDRPADNRARKITFQLELKPVKEIEGNCISCAGARGTFQVRCKIPDYQTEEVDFGVKSNGIIYFSEESPKDHRQSTMAFDEGDEDNRGT